MFLARLGYPRKKRVLGQQSIGRTRRVRNFPTCSFPSLTSLMECCGKKKWSDSEGARVEIKKRPSHKRTKGAAEHKRPAEADFPRERFLPEPWQTLQALRIIDDLARSKPFVFLGATPKPPAPSFARALSDLPPRINLGPPMLESDEQSIRTASSQLECDVIPPPSPAPGLPEIERVRGKREASSLGECGHQDMTVCDAAVAETKGGQPPALEVCIISDRELCNVVFEPQTPSHGRFSYPHTQAPQDVYPAKVVGDVSFGSEAPSCETPPRRGFISSSHTPDSFHGWSDSPMVSSGVSFGRSEATPRSHLDDSLATLQASMSTKVESVSFEEDSEEEREEPSFADVPTPTWTTSPLKQFPVADALSEPHFLQF
eukprot:gb/GEZN01003893.1/.p1 GENE.gb/GEZN01003893.1/~~gb/GEZN01003893.1/.p1  ORF type:complete len:373 (-),score=14.64 gb/GEZN01003893.1/:842-1960(-)